MPKWLDVKRARGTIENKMIPGPPSDKAATSTAEEEVPAKVPTPPPSRVVDRPTATPAAARMADELGVDLTKVEGSGVDGLIVVADVRSAADKVAAETEES